MNRYEYKLHRLSLKTGKSNDEQILEALNRFGQEGWRLNRMYGDFGLRSLASWRGGLNFILEREIIDERMEDNQSAATAFREISNRERS